MTPPVYGHKKIYKILLEIIVHFVMNIQNKTLSSFRIIILLHEPKNGLFFLCNTYTQTHTLTYTHKKKKF